MNRRNTLRSSPTIRHGGTRFNIPFNYPQSLENTKYYVSLCSLWLCGKNVMRILFLDPFHGGSHAAVAGGYAAHSRHEVTLLTLSQAGGWRWRMRGAAVTLARQVRDLFASGARFDLIVATDMLDLATFLGLTRDITAYIPIALYFHENQLTYPLPAGRKLDLSFPWINYTSALAADMLCFNSGFHRRAFLDALPEPRWALP